MIPLQDLLRRLARFSRTRRHLLNAGLAYRLGALAVVAGIAALVLLSGWLPSVLANLILFALIGLVLLGLGIVLVVRWTWFRSYLHEAFLLERLAGNLNSRVVSALDFLVEGVDNPLKARVIDRARTDLARSHEAKLDRRRRNHNRLVFGILFILFLAIGLTPLFAFGKVLNNFQRTWAEMQAYLFPIQYEVFPSPGTHVHLLGDKINVGIKLTGRSDIPVHMIKGDDDQTLLLEDGVAQTQLTSDVETEIRFHFMLGGRPSEEVTVIFTTLPTLVNMQTELVYPTYTRLLPRSLEGIQQRLLALPGTRITLGFTFSKDLQDASLTWVGEDAAPTPLDVVGRFATLTFMHQKRRTARLQVHDVHGFALEAPLLIDIEVQNDEKPVVLLPRHLKEDMPFLEEGVKLFGFGAQATDDFGITRVVLKWQKTTVDNSTTVLERGEVERLISPVQPKVLVNYDKVFAGLGLKPGDRISFEVEAYDNLSPGKPQMSKSRRCSFFVYQEGLGGLAIKELGLGAGFEPGQDRIAKSTRATSVKAPEGLRTKEMVWNQFEGSITTGTRPPTVRGEHGQATRDYFRLLSTVKDPEGQPPQTPMREPMKP
jgi:hypothetical protein